MEYGFNTELAQRFGVNEAIMIRNFQFWMLKNKSNEKNYFDGRYWTYNSLAAFCKIFPFWTSAQIRYILKKLVDNGILVTGNYNKNPYDKTVWYSLNEDILSEGKKEELPNNDEKVSEDKSSDLSENNECINLSNACDNNDTSMCENSNIDMLNLAHRCAKSGEPIPYVNTFTESDINTHTQKGVREILSNSSDVDAFCYDYKTFKNKEFEPSVEDKELIAKVLAKTGGYTPERQLYWQDVFKKASRGWKITEKDVTRIVPCSFEKVMAQHSKIKSGEYGLLPPIKEKLTEQPEVVEEVIEDIEAIDATRKKARVLIDQIRRTPYRMGQKYYD